MATVGADSGPDEQQILNLTARLWQGPVLTGDMVNNFSRETWRDDNVSMPWEETHAMDQRMKFILEWNAGLESKTELCRRYGIQRRSGYKWVQRYLRDGPAGLANRSRAPLHHPQQIAPERVARILEIRAAHPLWGAPKIRAVMRP